MSGSTTVAEARRRHPSARWPAPIDRLRSRVGQLLDLHGVPHADVAARVLEARGRTGLDVTAFARGLGIADSQVRAAEAGLVPVGQLPARLRQILG